MTWSALIPGIREIRGPLLAGYLWMLAIWLSLGNRLPGSNSNAVFKRLWEAGEAIGPLGRAAAASVVAYLFGELMNGTIRNVIRFIRARGRLGRLTLGNLNLSLTTFSERAGEDGWVSVNLIENRLNRIWDGPTDSGALLTSARQLINLEEAELGGAQEEVRGGIRHALAVSGGEARCQILPRPDGSETIFLPRSDQDLAELTLPRFSPYSDVWQRRPLLETRLREVVPLTASKIERLDAEAEFREAIAPPLLAIVLIVALGSSLWWLALLLVPAALLLQASAFRSDAGRELVDALRARSGSPELEKVTPVFAIYRANATALKDALITANWGNLRFIEAQEDED